MTLEEEFKKNKELKREDFQNLKEWYALQTHLPSIQDELLAYIYHSCFYKMEAAKTTIDNYFTVRTHARELFADRDPFTVNVRNGKPVVFYTFLSKPTHMNHRVMFMKLLNTDPSAYVFSEASKAFFMQYDLELFLNGTYPGDEMVFDMNGVALGHLARLTLPVVKQVLHYMQEAMPVRLKHLHFINVVSFMDKIMALLRPFMNREFADKFVFHTEGIESLLKFVPLKNLPKDYGGEEKSVAELADEQLKLVQGKKNWFDREENLRVDESKRPVMAKTESEVFGVKGSFKKLDFD